MRRVVAGLVAGIVLGTTGVAGASQYWDGRGNGYTCEGVAYGMSCKSGNFEVGITKDFVFLQHRRTEQTYGCRKHSGFASCFEG